MLRNHTKAIVHRIRREMKVNKILFERKAPVF